MASQRDLFDAQAEADAAIAKVKDGCPLAWWDQALAALKFVAQKQAELTTDDLWSLITSPPEPRAMGALMREGAERNWIVATDRTRKSSRVECHARPVRVWKSKLFGG